MKHLRFNFGLRGPTAATALALAAAVMLIPANLLPVLTTDTSGNERNDTILSGALQLWQHGLGAIAIIVITASIIIPILKLVGLGWIIFSIRRGPPKNARRLTRVYVALDFIGRWSMLDVFLAAFLTGLVQFGELTMVQARSGIVAFAAAVILTVLATQAFDPRAIWADQPDPNPSNTP
jgi:paraquat-inducible protein A